MLELFFVDAFSVKNNDSFFKEAFIFLCMRVVLSFFRGKRPVFSFEITPSQVWPETHNTIVCLFSRTAMKSAFRYNIYILSKYVHHDSARKETDEGVVRFWPDLGGSVLTRKNRTFCTMQKKYKTHTRE